MLTVSHFILKRGTCGFEIRWGEKLMWTYRRICQKLAMINRTFINTSSSRLNLHWQWINMSCASYVPVAGELRRTNHMAYRSVHAGQVGRSYVEEPGWESRDPREIIVIDWFTTGGTWKRSREPGSRLYVCKSAIDKFFGWERYQEYPGHLHFNNWLTRGLCNELIVEETYWGRTIIIGIQVKLLRGRCIPYASIINAAHIDAYIYKGLPPWELTALPTSAEWVDAVWPNSLREFLNQWHPNIR